MNVKNSFVNNKYSFLNNKNNNRNKINNNESEKIVLVHWNCNSVNNKIDELKLFCVKYKPHIITLNKTDDKAQYILQIDKYVLIHKSRRVDKNGAGGVALLIREDLKFCSKNLFDSLNLEICAINLTMNNKEISIISYYNPPQETFSEKIFEI